MLRIKELREEKGLMQQELADILYIKQATVSSWELGKSQPNIDTLIQLANIFLCSVDYLIGNVDNTDPTYDTSNATPEQQTLLTILQQDKQYNTLLRLYAKLSVADKATVIKHIKTLIH